LRESSQIAPKTAQRDISKTLAEIGSLPCRGLRLKRDGNSKYLAASILCSRASQLFAARYATAVFC